MANMMWLLFLLASLAVVRARSDNNNKRRVVYSLAPPFEAFALQPRGTDVEEEFLNRALESDDCLRLYWQLREQSPRLRTVEFDQKSWSDCFTSVKAKNIPRFSTSRSMSRITFTRNSEVVLLYGFPVRCVYFLDTQFVDNPNVLNSQNHWNYIDSILSSNLPIYSLSVGSVSSEESQQMGTKADTKVEFMYQVSGVEEKKSIYQTLCEMSQAWVIAPSELPFMFTEDGCKIAVSSGYLHSKVEETICSQVDLAKQDTTVRPFARRLAQAWNDADQSVQNEWDFTIPWNQGLPSLQTVQSQLMSLKEQNTLPLDALDFIWCNYVSGLDCYGYCYSQNIRAITADEYDLAVWNRNMERVFNEVRGSFRMEDIQDTHMPTSTKEWGNWKVIHHSFSPIAESAEKALSFQASIVLKSGLDPETKSQQIWSIALAFLQSEQFSWSSVSVKSRETLLLEDILLVFSVETAEEAESTYQQICELASSFHDSLGTTFPPMQYRAEDCLVSIVPYNRIVSFPSELCDDAEQLRVSPSTFVKIRQDRNYPMTNSWNFESTPNTKSSFPNRLFKGFQTIPGFSEASHHWNVQE